MIVVTVGTNEAPFDRLLQAVDALSGSERLVVQHGASRIRPAGATCFPFLPFEELLAYVRGARMVVTHAGVGSIMVSLASGKRPVVVPRLRRFREAVDDHQVLLGRRLAASGLVTFLERPERLGDVLTEGPGEGSPPDLGGTSPLAAELRSFLTEAIGSPLRAAS